MNTAFRQASPVFLPVRLPPETVIHLIEFFTIAVSFLVLQIFSSLAIAEIGSSSPFTIFRIFDYISSDTQTGLRIFFTPRYSSAWLS